MRSLDGRARHREDAIGILEGVFRGPGQPETSLDAADANDDGGLDISECSPPPGLPLSLAALRPAAPHPECGLDLHGRRPTGAISEPPYARDNAKT